MNNFSSNAIDTKRLHRRLGEIVKSIEETNSYALTVAEVFSIERETLRSKLKTYCEKLILEDPIFYVPKTEELLWRQGYHNVVGLVNKLQHGNLDEDGKLLLASHLESGIGFYQKLITHLHNKFCIQDQRVDYTCWSKAGNFTEKYNQDKLSTEIKNCVSRFTQRCYICLGDLARYRLKLNLEPDWNPSIASRFYKTAITLDPKNGMPYNQLAHLAGDKNYGLDAVYYFLKCTICPKPFPGSERNLESTILKYSRGSTDEDNNIKNFVAKFCKILISWRHKSSHFNNSHLKESTIQQDLENCLNAINLDLIDHKSIDNNSISENSLKNEKNYSANYFTFKLMAICLMEISKKQNNDNHRVIKFMLEFVEELLKFSNGKLQDYLSNVPQLSPSSSRNSLIDVTTCVNLTSDMNIKDDSTKEKPEELNIKENGIDDTQNAFKKALPLILKGRRKRRVKIYSDSSDDESDDGICKSPYRRTNGTYYSDESSSDDELSDSSDEVHTDYSTTTVTSEDQKVGKEIEAQCSSTVGENTVFAKNIDSRKPQQSLENVIQGMGEEKMLSAIKIFCDWLHGRQDVIHTFSNQLKTVMEHFTTMLNLINIDSYDVFQSFTFENGTSLKNNIKLEAAPLPEDVELRNMTIFQQAHSEIDWEFFVTKTMTRCEEAYLRVSRIIKFGMQLCSVKKSGLRYDEESHTFIYNCPEEREFVRSQVLKPPQKIIINPSKELLMKNMAQLWREEKEEENKSKGDVQLLPPYLVPDHEALTRYLAIIKHLVYSKQFIIVIPLTVLSALDEMKKFSIQAREVTRWLEKLLKNGSQYVRLQKDNEKLPLQLAPPKRGEKVSWRYYNIFKCCLFFSETKPEEDLVRLLTGFSDSGLNLNHMNELTNSTGIKYEHIGSFHAKWKKAFGNHG
ncbi:protein SMG5 [Trichogramma pretiosum]|uniref:protein SMG5 n=1 Tax=Trichogramma pretiosum TaxID=7493 RepID=UPI0006C996B7|nr:protein SMG5 [Trichogramma pretiosum]